MQVANGRSILLIFSSFLDDWPRHKNIKIRRKKHQKQNMFRSITFLFSPPSSVSVLFFCSFLFFCFFCFLLLSSFPLEQLIREQTGKYFRQRAVSQVQNNVSPDVFVLLYSKLGLQRDEIWRSMNEAEIWAESHKTCDIRHSFNVASPRKSIFWELFSSFHSYAPT